MEHHDPEEAETADMTIVLSNQSRLRPSMPTLPEDIICEILKHCRGLDWSYKHFARICLVQPGAWLDHARRALYRELRLDYRHEVDRLISCLSLRPANGSLVQHIVVNGDAAHVPNTITFLQSLSAVQRVTFFDFELFPGTEQQKNLCQSLVGPSLKHLSLQILPNDFVTEVIKAAAPYLYSLRVYRAALSVSEGWEQDEDWHFPHLESLELDYTGDISAETFRQLVVRPSRRLRRLQLHYECSRYALTYEETPWLQCSFENLESLQLQHFHVDVVQCILQQCHDKALKQLTLTALKAGLVIDSGFQSLGTSPPHSYMSGDEEGGDLPCLSFLANLPPSLQYLQILKSRTPGLLSPLSYLLARQPKWLPSLKRLPRITFAISNIEEEPRQYLKKATLEAGAARNLYATEKDKESFFGVTSERQSS